jgi:hypothetical protein
MPSRNEKTRRRLAKAKAAGLSGPVPAVGGDKVQNQTVSQLRTEEEPKERGAKPLSWARFQNVTIGVFIWATGGILNYFGSNPRILYLPAAAFCVLVMLATHRYVSRQLAKASPSPVIHPPQAPPTEITFTIQSRKLPGEGLEFRKKHEEYNSLSGAAAL